jgi:hypothetical protein
MAYCQDQTSLWGNNNDKYIKFLNSSIVAVDGADTVENQVLSALRIKYAQITRARITLKPGQTDFLLNYGGLGDGISFLSIVATYDPKSKIEADNYLQYAFYNDLTRLRTFCEIMVLTGNSTNLIPQIYLTNPNVNYPVMLDVLMASKSDTYNPFEDTINQSGTSFVGLSYSSIKTHVLNDSIKIVNSQNSPLIYLQLANINSIERTGLILTVDDSSRGEIFLKFGDTYSVNQGFSLMNYILENPGVNTQTLSPLEDNVAPIVYFYNTVVGTSSTIDLIGGTGGPYNTSQGFTFSATMSLGFFGTISNNLLVDVLVDSVSDNRDGVMSITGSNLIVTKDSTTYTSITASGTYSVTFTNVKDLAENSINGVILTLTITS